MDDVFYKCVRPILYIFIKLYRPIYIGLENIPKNKSFILVGNHTSYLDPILVASTTKECVHFFAKDSLYKGIKKPLFKTLGIIPVDSTKKDKNALNLGIKYLNDNKVIGIFPEGTINKTNEKIMKFKYGSVKMSKETGKLIVPFAINGKYKFLRKNVSITISKPYFVKDDLEIENEKLMEIVKNMISKDDVNEWIIWKIRKYY